MQYVEIAGIPGSGKTSVVNSFVGSRFNSSLRYYSYRQVALQVLQNARNRLGAALVEVLPAGLQNRLLYQFLLSSRIGRAALCRAVANHAELAVKIFDNIAKEENTVHQQLLASWLTHLLTCYQLAVESLGQDQCLMLDEGFVGRVITLFGFHDGMDFGDGLGEYLPKIPPVDILFVVETPVEVCLDRMSRRGFPKRLTDLDQVKRRSILRQCETCIEKAADFLASGGTRVVRISGENDLAQLVQQVRREIESSPHHNRP